MKFIETEATCIHK